MNDDVPTPEWLKEHFFKHYDPCKLNSTNKVGLIEEWKDHTFVNPPYSNPKPWVEKAILESRKGKHITMLLRVDVSTRWYKLLMKENIHIAYFNERIFRGSNFCSMLVFIEP